MQDWYADFMPSLTNAGIRLATNNTDNHNLQPINNSCPHCHKSFNTKQALASHRHTQHDDKIVARWYQRNTSCNICMVEFHTRQRVLRHLNESATGCLEVKVSQQLPLEDSEVASLDIAEAAILREERRTGTKAQSRVKPHLRISGPLRSYPCSSESRIGPATPKPAYVIDDDHSDMTITDDEDDYLVGELPTQHLHSAHYRHVIPGLLDDDHGSDEEHEHDIVCLNLSLTEDEEPSGRLQASGDPAPTALASLSDREVGFAPTTSEELHASFESVLDIALASPKQEADMQGYVDQMLQLCGDRVASKAFAVWSASFTEHCCLTLFVDDFIVFELNNATIVEALRTRNLASPAFHPTVDMQLYDRVCKERKREIGDMLEKKRKLEHRLVFAVRISVNS